MATYSRWAPSPCYFKHFADSRPPATLPSARERHGIAPPVGENLPRHAVAIKMLIDRFGARSLLDYGAGQGTSYGPLDVQLPDGTRFSSIPDYWAIDVLDCYDPVRDPLHARPIGLYDGVICTEFLERCPADKAPEVLGELFGHARSFVFAHVTTDRGAMNRGGGDEIVRDRSWWQSSIGRVARNHPEVRYKFLVDSYAHTPGGRCEARSALICG
jgi:hypothetical protein